MSGLNKSTLLVSLLLILASCPQLIYAQDTKNKGYIIHSKSAHISSIDIRRLKGSSNNIKIQLTNSNAGSTYSVTPPADTLNSGRWYTILPPEISHIKIVEGVYSSIQRSPDNRRYSINTMYQVQFPFRMKIEISDENLEVEFTEPGNWSMSVALDNIYNPDMLVAPALTDQ